MRLIRLYSNKPEVFLPVVFGDGLSVVLGEIRLPQNKMLDTHNLGKTLFGELLDFCLLKGKNGNFFLFKHPGLFSEMAFYLELRLDDGTYLTIGRSVTPGTRIDFMRSDGPVDDATKESVESWDHQGLPIDRAKPLLDGYLGFAVLQPWGLRKLVGYLIRSQADYQDVFQLGKFSGKHQDWKPFVAHLLGLSAQSVLALYEKREEYSAATAHLQSIAREWGDEATDPSVVDGLISVKRRDVEARETAMNSFDLAEEDSRVVTILVEDVESRIAGLNEERYKILQLLERIAASLTDGKIMFRPADAEKLFKQAGLLLGDQVTRTYEQLIRFNLAITQERREALESQRDEAAARLRSVDDELSNLAARRAESLEYLRKSEALEKYKELAAGLATLRADMLSLEARRSAAARIVELRQQQRSMLEELNHLETSVEAEIDAASKDESSRFGRMRRFFTEVIYEVLGQNAILAIKMNLSGGIEFSAEFVGESGNATSGDKGTSYKKLLCIAFDLALLRTYLDVPFSRFVYHDGALEQLEPRKRENLLRVFKHYADLGLQPVISSLDSDFPAEEPEQYSSSRTSVILRLHDEGADGRLFKMNTW